jgi:CheY-like chemotaxis protein
MKQKILVVDDEPDALEVLGFKLREAGFTPLFATDGLKALAAGRAARSGPSARTSWCSI